MIATSAWYVFGVVDATVAGLKEDIVLVRVGPLAAVITEVPLEDFGTEALPERLNDRAWLEQHAQAHEEVLRGIAATTAVVPFRFGTVYHDLDGVRALLTDRAEELCKALDRVRGRVEIGVKVWADRARFTAALADLAAPTSGRAYLERRRTEQDSARRAAVEMQSLATEAHRRLLQQAVEGVSNRPQPRELTGRPEAMLLNGAYLVADGGEALEAEASKLQAELAPRGVTIELTGPWPPHNFVELETAS